MRNSNLILIKTLFLFENKYYIYNKKKKMKILTFIFICLLLILSLSLIQTIESKCCGIPPICQGKGGCNLFCCGCENGCKND